MYKLYLNENLYSTLYVLLENEFTLFSWKADNSYKTFQTQSVLKFVSYYQRFLSVMQLIEESSNSDLDVVFFSLLTISNKRFKSGIDLC